MRNRLIEIVETKYQRPRRLEFEVGDDVVVTLKISEGTKERLQDFEGTVIARKGSGLDEMFTVRRLISDQGVERVFPIHSPKIVAIKVKRSGKVRRCKLYYLRDRVGKSRRLKQRRVSVEKRRTMALAREEKARKEAEASQVVATSKAAESSDAAMATT